MYCQTRHSQGGQGSDENDSATSTRLRFSALHESAQSLSLKAKEALVPTWNGFATIELAASDMVRVARAVQLLVRSPVGSIQTGHVDPSQFRVFQRR